MPKPSDMPAQIGQNQSRPPRKGNKQVFICKVAELPPATRKIVEVDGKSIGVFNVKGQFYALLNYCPHKGGPVCSGPITGTPLTTDKFEFIYGYEDELVRCGWHGWEFEIASGQALIDPKMRVRTYNVTIENGDEVVLHV